MTSTFALFGRFINPTEAPFSVAGFQFNSLEGTHLGVRCPNCSTV